VTPHVEIQRAPHERAVIEIYIEGKRVSVGKAMAPTTARAAAIEIARAFGSQVIDHTTRSAA
jgi:hypothetical protein